MISYGKQHITQSDIDAVCAVLKSDYLTQGPAIPQFEKAVAEMCGAKYGVAVNSATAALHIACLALDVGVGDRVWTTPNSFVASANAALYCGAQVNFVDIDATTFNMSTERLKQMLEKAQAENKLPKVVIPVHFAGQSCDMKGIKELAKKYNFKIIEDASHAIGGKHLNRFIGDCAYSDITVFSFHPVKIITTGEGGLATTNDATLNSKMQLYRSHGITRDAQSFCERAEGAWCYEQQVLGFNYRMTDIQAALGLSQLARCHDYVLARNRLAEYYTRELKGSPVFCPQVGADNYSSFHLYVIRIDFNAVKKTRAEIFSALIKKDIGVNVHYMPIYLQPYYKNKGFRAGLCPVAESVYKQSLTIPLHPQITAEQAAYILNNLREVIG